MNKPSVFLAVPSRGSISLPTNAALLQCGGSGHRLKTFSCSLLTLSFNTLWCEALNARRDGITHFVMLHDDVGPIDDGWIDTLLAEQQKAKADILSAVIPIKDERGLTSTAVYDRRTNRMRRLTMTEVTELPPTFDAERAGYPGCVLLPNTGLWVCDFTRPWVEEICFTIRDKNFVGPEGKWVAQCFSEDWDFGIQAQRLGLRVCATTAVKLIHRGGFDYPNFTAWGGMKSDGAWGAWEPNKTSRPMPEPIYDPEPCLAVA